MTEVPCPFCEIVAGRAPATIVEEWPNTLAIVPLAPVVDGHLLVIPKLHVRDFVEAPVTAGETMRRASDLAAELNCPMNLITSKGREATQSVFHLHLHLIPRAVGDGLALPWDFSKKSAGMQINIQPKPDDDAFARGFAAGRRAR